MTAPLRLRLDGTALADNWRALDRLSGAAACGAAVKADAYGLGVADTVVRLANAGARDFYVATWDEAAAFPPFGLPLSVLHGVREADMDVALNSHARPVLNTAAQVARWKAAGGGACDVMVDTGMNRLGVSVDEVRAGLLDGLSIDTLMSHLASADEDSPMNARQRDALAGMGEATNARRLSLANSAGIALGEGYAFDLTRPGLALYGGVPVRALAAVVRQVVFPQAEILQRRLVRAGESVGYNAMWTAATDTEVAILNIGYADGYFRGFSNIGHAAAGGARLPVIGRVSMDLLAVDVGPMPTLAEGDWVGVDLTLAGAAMVSGMSQYELLTSLGARYERVWD
ncbi:MAG: alanine racemase [Sphingomonas bacterium]|uniref:alanine racemase n=1 Tax=Sphingomonas bacterium TaxID=1895847 RepID=UPI00260A3FA9|nr:alanine racemase [Sphingomonas bacterium]MDB5694586.1 alanine racemase [Sphingomonas bacterium]